MKRTLLFSLIALIAIDCTQYEPSPDLAGQLVGTYATTQISLNWQNYESAILMASNGQITITRVGSSLNQIKLSFSYTLSQQGTSLYTTQNTDAELIELQQVKGDNRIHFKGVSPTNLGWYLGYWSNQNTNVSGSYLNKSFTAVKK